MKNLLSAFIFSILILGTTETSFSSERGGNSGFSEALEQALFQHKLSGKCAYDTELICRQASGYLEQMAECKETLSNVGCDLVREVEEYSLTCCHGIDG